MQGLLPPGFATDEAIETQGIISQAFTYRGLHSAVTLLTRLGTRGPRSSPRSLTTSATST